MATARRNLQSVKTMAALVDRRRARSHAGALLEMSTLANEKDRLSQELDRAQRRRTEIEARLSEIAAKEQRLRKFIKNPAPGADAEPRAEPARSMKMKEFGY